MGTSKQMYKRYAPESKKYEWRPSLFIVKIIQKKIHHLQSVMDPLMRLKPAYAAVFFENLFLATEMSMGNKEIPMIRKITFSKFWLIHGISPKK